MSEKVRWGVCGAGKIAGVFSDTQRAIGGTVLAIASKEKERAEAFRARHGLLKAYGDYRALAEDEEIDAVYVATNHPDHAAAALLYLSAGKAVLVEKPMALNGKQVAELTACAERHGALLMEAMWTRFLPATACALEIAAGGELGEIRYADCKMGFRFSPDVVRAFRNDLGGGALLDLGVYTLNYADWLLGGLTDVTSAVRLSGGVDRLECITAKGRSGGIASLCNAVDAEIGYGCTLYGTDGSVTIPKFNAADALEVTAGGKTRRYSFPHRATGYEYEIQHFERLLTEGAKQSPLMPLSQTARITAIMDGLRREWGLRFLPHEQE